MTSNNDISAIFLSIGTMLNKHRFELHNEKALQADIERVFIENNVPYQREVTLSDGNIIDFMVEQLGIEVKLKGSPRGICRQCERYCQHEQVGGLMLITNKAMKLPNLNNKFTYVLNLGTAWL